MHPIILTNNCHCAILFGGNGQNSEGLDDTWIFDFKKNSWIQLEPKLHPSARDHFILIYEPKMHVAIGYGAGQNVSDISDMTWQFNIKDNTWSPYKITNSPAFRDHHALAYDSTNQKILLFGGYGGIGDGKFDALGDFWELNPYTELQIATETDISVTTSNGFIAMSIIIGMLSLSFLKYKKKWKQR